jgi:hypothetical protein
MAKLLVSRCCEGGLSPRGGFQRSARGLGVDHTLLFGPAQGVRLAIESLCGSQLSIHEDDDGYVLRVRINRASMTCSPRCRRQMVRGV